MITDTTTKHGPARTGRRWPALIVVVLATFMDVIDVTIVNVALPTIQRDLHAGYSVGQWLVAGYALAYALLLIIGGRLGDLAGRRRMFILGVAGFTAASATAGAAISPEMLICARVAQGAFGGIMVPQVMALIATRFTPGRERTIAFSLYGALLGVAQFSGPLLGGVLTDLSPFGLSWRAIFYINVPIGLLAVTGAARWMGEPEPGPGPENEPGNGPGNGPGRAAGPDAGWSAGWGAGPETGPGGLRTRLDMPGVALVAAASLLVVFPLVEWHRLVPVGTAWTGAGAGAGPVRAFASIAAAVPALLLFVSYERRRERRGLLPLVPLGLFRLRSFSAGLVLLLVLFSGTAAYFIALTWHLQFGLGWSPTHVALTSVAWPAGIACTAQLTHRYGHRRGRLLVGSGTAIMSAGAVVLAWVIAADGAALSSARIVPCMVLSGIGMGMTIPILSNLVLGDVPPADAGAASGVLNSIIQLGGAFGVALAGVIFFAGSSTAAAALSVPRAGSILGRTASPAARIGHLPLGAESAIISEFVTGAARALSYSAAVFLLAALLAPLLPRRAAHGERLAPETASGRPEGGRSLGGR